MDNTFDDGERLYRTVYPPFHPGLFWKRDGRIFPSAFADPKGLSIERGYYRKSEEVVEKMKKTFSGCIVSLTVRDCRDVDAVVKYLPSKSNSYYSEVHGSEHVVLLSKSQRFHLVEVANVKNFFFPSLQIIWLCCIIIPERKIHLFLTQINFRLRRTYYAKRSKEGSRLYWKGFEAS